MKLNIHDPTHSRALRDDYTRILLKIVKRFKNDTIENLRRVFLGFALLEEIAVFAKGRSFDSARAIASLKTKITPEERRVIRRVIRVQAVHGVKLALNQARVPKKQRGVLGQYINEGTFEVLNRVNVDLIRSVQQKFLDRVKLLIARFVGGGVLTWNKLKKGIKVLGNITDRQAAQIARTEVIRTVSTMQKETLAGLGKKKWKWITMLDEKVCVVCGPLHGKIVVIGKPFRTWKGQSIINSPAHPNCRCGQEVVV